jgi:hypothetical protein
MMKIGVAREAEPVVPRAEVCDGASKEFACAPHGVVSTRPAYASMRLGFARAPTVSKRPSWVSAEMFTRFVRRRELLAQLANLFA